MVSERTIVLNEIADERERQIQLVHGGDTTWFDRTNTANDWIAYTTAYIGRAIGKRMRNVQENKKFRENMIKAAALCVAAVEAYDNGFIKESE